MKIYKEISLADFEAWGGAEKTLARVKDYGLCENLEAILADENSEWSAESLNDLLRYEPDTVYNWLGLETESDINEELEGERLHLEHLKGEKPLVRRNYDDLIDGKQRTLGYVNEEPQEEYYILTSSEEEIASVEKIIKELEEELKNYF